MLWLTPKPDPIAQLSAAIVGAELVTLDWMAIIAAANANLLTSELAGAMCARPQATPADATEFLREVALRNRRRNGAIRGELLDAISALNASGIEPTILKGAALWWLLPDHHLETRNRMMVDIDLLVAPHQRQLALSALTRGGFTIWAEHSGEDVHVFAQLSREGAPASIDLHQRPAGPPGLANAIWGDRASIPVEVGNLHLRVPTPETYIFLATIHDQFHDSGFWSGALHLRHLRDIADLSTAGRGINWDQLLGLCTTELTHTALLVQLIAATELFGAAAPSRLLEPASARSHYARMRLQARGRTVRRIMALIALLLSSRLLIRHSALNSLDRKRLLSPAFHAENWRDRFHRLARAL